MNPSKERNISVVQVSPGSHRHGNTAYIKVSTTDGGKYKIVSREDAYTSDGKQKTKIYYPRRKKKMISMNENIIPYEGLDSFKFGNKLEDVRRMLKEANITFNQCMGEKQYIRPDLKHEIITINNSIKLYFVDGILFEIGLQKDFKGQLPNGIRIGIDITEAEEMDSNLQYDEEEEAFVSSEGYIVIDNIDSSIISYIEIYIPEVEKSEEFFQYQWLERFK